MQLFSDMTLHAIWIVETFLKKMSKKKNNFVSRNASDEKNLHPGDRSSFLINLVEFLKFTRKELNKDLHRK